MCRNYKGTVTGTWTALRRWNAWPPAPVLSHVFGKSRHDPKSLRCEQFSDSYNKPSLSSAGKKPRQTPKLPIPLQWIIWLVVTFVWHNLHGIHKLLFVLWCSKPANLERAKPSDFPVNAAGRKLAGLCFSSLVRMHKPGCSYARMEITRAGHTNMQCPSTRSLWNPPCPKEGASKIPCSMRDCIRQWVRRSCLLDQKITARFPNLSVLTSIQCPSTAGWPLAIAHNPQFGKHPRLMIHSLASIWAFLYLLFNLKKYFMPKI